jgi:hypothetical protein
VLLTNMVGVERVEWCCPPERTFARFSRQGSQAVRVMRCLSRLMGLARLEVVIVEAYSSGSGVLLIRFDDARLRWSCAVGAGVCCWGVPRL